MFFYFCAELFGKKIHHTYTPFFAWIACLPSHCMDAPGWGGGAAALVPGVRLYHNPWARERRGDFAALWWTAVFVDSGAGVVDGRGWRPRRSSFCAHPEGGLGVT